MRKRLSTSSWENKYDIQNRSVLNKVGTPITCWTQLGIQAKSFESLARCPQGHRCLLLKENRPLNSVGVLSITGGEGGIRLHPAGRDLACKPSPSNHTREVRRDFTPLRNENAPRGAFELLAERVGFEPTVPCSTPDFESGTFDHSATSPGRKRVFPKDRDCIRTR